MAQEQQQEQSDGGQISPELIQKLFDAGLVDKNTLDRAAVKTQTDKAGDDLSDAAAPVIDEASKATGMKHKDIVDKVFPYLMNAEDASKDPNAVSPKGAVGVSQVMPATAADEAKKLGMKDYDLTNPDDNKKIGSRYLDDRLEDYKGDPELALAAYNAGPGTVNKALKKSGGSTYDDIKNYLPSETRAYVKKIDASFQNKEGMGLKDIKANIASQAEPAPQAEAANQPGIYDKIKSGLAAEFSGEAEAEEPQTPAPAQAVAATPTAVPPPMGAQTSPPTDTNPPVDVTQTPAAASGPAVTPIPGTSPPPDATVQPAVTQGPVDPLAAASIPTEQPQADPNENVALANASNTAQAGDSVGTINNLAAGQAPPDTNTQMQNAFALEQMGKTQEAQAVAEGAQNEAALYAQKAKGIAQVGVDFAQKRIDLEAIRQKDMDVFRQKNAAANDVTIDPDHFFTSKSTFGKILFAISLAAVALGGKPGQASALIDRAIDQDIGVQKANIALRQKNLADQKDLIGMDKSQIATLNLEEVQKRAEMTSYITALIDQSAANTKDAMAKAQLIDLSGTLKQKQLTLEEKFAQDNLKHHADMQMDAAAFQGLGPLETYYAKRAQTDAKFAQNLVNVNGKPAGVAKSPAASTSLDVAGNTRDLITNQLDTLKKIVASSNMGDQVLSGADTQRAEDAIAEIHKQLIAASPKSRMAKALADTFQQKLPTGTFDSSLMGVGRLINKPLQMLGLERRLGTRLDDLQKAVDTEYVQDANTLMIPRSQTDGFRGYLQDILSKYQNLPDVKKKY